MKPLSLTRIALAFLCLSATSAHAQLRVAQAQFNFNIISPPIPQGPVFASLGTYSLLPDADLRLHFSGTVILPPGNWELGIVQNVWNDRVTIAYDKGGVFHFSYNGPPVLDIITGHTDIWLDPFGTGKISLSNTTTRDKEFHFTLESADTPTSPPIPALQSRCNLTITEKLVFAERVLQFVAILVARKDGAAFPLAATSGNTYGFMWRLEPAPGAPNFHFKPFFSTGVERAQPFSLLHPHGVGLTRPSANEMTVSLVAHAEAEYLADCGVRTPPEGDVHFYP